MSGHDCVFSSSSAPDETDTALDLIVDEPALIGGATGSMLCWPRLGMARWAA